MNAMNSAETPTTISMILVEDNRLLREGLDAMVRCQQDLNILAAVGDRENVLLKVQQLQPEVVLIDLGLLSQSSLRLAETISREHSEVKLVVMGLLPADGYVIEFVKAGVAGFLMRDATFDEFMNTIRSVALGAKVLPPSLTGALFSEIAELAARREGSLLSSSVRLTKREREITCLIAEGHSNKEIAQQLNLATFTVKSHVHNILEKLALRTRVQVASFYAREQSISRQVVQTT